ncbi:MAG: LytTR family DNA-binding domain-containing protein [Eubacteriales bacterium]|nr:LytTR family DNA-binding domain-containing protein [Eubacteriales bacterium]
MKIAICDDCEADRQTLLRYLSTYLGENYVNDVELTQYVSAEELLAERTLPDLLFLDVYMGQLSGMDAARQLMQRDYQGGIVFTTTSKEFGAESYEVNAIDYLLKPFSYDRFLRTVKKCDESLHLALAYLNVPSGRQEIKVFLRELKYIETGNHCLLFHTKRETIQSPLTMEQTVTALKPYPDFIRCHRSYIINLAAVEDVTETNVLLTGGDSVLLTVKNATALRRQIADYLWREMEARHE